MVEHEDQEAIRKLTEEWLAALRAKDVGRLKEMVTDDVVFLPSTLPPIRGKQAVEDMYNSFLPQFSSVEQSVSTQEVRVAGDWAFAWGFETLVPNPPGWRPGHSDEREGDEHSPPAAGRKLEIRSRHQQRGAGGSAASWVKKGPVRI